jgi:hypothetical protein
MVRPIASDHVLAMLWVAPCITDALKVQTNLPRKAQKTRKEGQDSSDGNPDRYRGSQLALREIFLCVLWFVFAAAGSVWRCCSN